MYAHHVELVIAIDVADCELARRAFSRTGVDSSAQLARSVSQHHEDAASRAGGDYVKFAVAIEIAHGWAAERDSRRAGGRYRSLKSPIAFAQQYGDVFAEDQIGFAVPVEVADGH